MSDTLEAHALAALEWYHMAGITEALATEPQNHMLRARMANDALIQQRQASKQPKAQPPKPPPSSAAPLPALAFNQSEAIAQAQTLANGADTLEALYEAIRGFDGCALKKTARNTVTHDGYGEQPRVMVIGEAPGADEDRQGIPFCGVSGQLLDKMLGSIHLSRDKNIYVTNMVFWRPPGNRNPTAEELAVCRPFVRRHIALVQPSMLLLVGGIAAKEMLQVNVGITKLRGQWHRDPDHTDLPVLATLHPSYLLRQPAQKKHAWHDMLMLNTFIRKSIG